MVLRAAPGALELEARPVPAPGSGEVLVRVEACGVCRTDLHLLDGELAGPILPVVPGHQAVGRVEVAGPGRDAGLLGQRLGVPWMGGIPSFPYALLWGERVLRSVANLTRRDGQDFFALAGRVKLRSETRSYPLEATNQALDDLRHGRFQGAAVLVP